MNTNDSIDIPEDIRILLGEYIDNLRAERKLGFNQLSLKSGLNPRTLNEIINGKSKRTNPFHLKKLGKALKIDYRDLYKIVGYLENDSDSNFLDHNINNIISLNKFSTLEIPVYSIINSKNKSINLEKKIRTTSLLIISANKIPLNAFSIEIHDKSMYPTFIEKDLIIVAPAHDKLINNDIYVISYNDEVLIKRVIEHEKVIQLTSDNQDKKRYPDIIILKDDNDSLFKCLGKIIRLERNI